MSDLHSLMLSNMITAETKIDWTKALNPTDDEYEAYNDAASYIVEPECFLARKDYDRLQDEIDAYHIMDNDVDAWKGVISNLISTGELSDNWMKLADVVIEYGY